MVLGRIVLVFTVLAFGCFQNMEAKLVFKNLYYKYDPHYCNFTANYTEKNGGIVYNSWLDQFVDTPKAMMYYSALATKSLKSGNYEKLFDFTYDPCKMKGKSSNYFLTNYLQAFQGNNSNILKCPFKKDIYMIKDVFISSSVIPDFFRMNMKFIFNYEVKVTTVEKRKYFQLYQIKIDGELNSE